MNDDTGGRRLSRRSALRWIAVAPAAAAAAGAAIAAEAKDQNEPKDDAGSGASKAPARPSSYAKFISKDERGLTGEQKKQLLKQAPGLEGALAKLREYPIPDDVEPALTFQALRGKSRVRA